MRRYPPRPLSGRVRAVLGLGVILGLSSVATAASWTDAAQVTGTAFSSGTIDVQLNNANSVASTTLSMSNMVPGSSSAEVFTVKNAGSAAFTYTITGGMSGGDASSYASDASLQVTIRAGGTRSGSGNSATCTGGTALVSNQALTASTGTTLVGTAQGPLAPAATASLCFQVALSSSASTTLQGKSTGATFSVNGTSTP